jgi:hypothetical protein
MDINHMKKYFWFKNPSDFHDCPFTLPILCEAKKEELCVPDKLIKRFQVLNASFNNLYRDKWSLNLNSSDQSAICIRRVWMSVLQNYDMSIITNAISSLSNTNNHTIYAPTAIQFNILCKKLQSKG